MLWTLSACLSTPAPLPGLELTGVTWTQSWDSSAVLSTEDANSAETGAGRAWTTTTDLGFRVTVESGFLVTYSLSLRDCPQPALRWSPIGAAVAAHGPTGGPEALAHPRVTDLAKLAPVELATYRFGSIRKCGVEVLLARADRKTVGIPDGVDLYGRSIALAGRWSRDGVETPFSWSSTLSNSRVTDLAEVTTTGSGTHARIDLHLAPGRMFDGIALDSMSEGLILRSILTNLIDQTAYRVTLTPSDSP